jgi:hypothetical protein
MVCKSVASLVGLKGFYLPAYANEFATGANKKPRLNFVVTGSLCPGLDSNQHTLSGTTTSKWLVYQFQHLGK